MIHKAAEGKALIRNGLGGPLVSFGTMISLPIVHRVSELDISVQKIEISFLEKNGLSCRDGIKADLKIAFFLAPIQTARDILRIHQSFGSDLSGNPTKLKAVFDAKFTEAVKSCARGKEFTELLEERDEFRDNIIKSIGNDLHGFMLTGCAIEYLDQTALEFHDPNNIIDAQGIKKITELTLAAQMKTNEMNREIAKNEAIQRAQSK